MSTQTQGGRGAPLKPCRRRKAVPDLNVPLSLHDDDDDDDDDVVESSARAFTEAKNNALRTGRRPVPVVVDVDLDSGRTNGLPQNNHNKRRRGLSTQTVTNCGPYINIDDSNSSRRSTVQSRAPTPPPPPPPPTEPIFSCPICMGPFVEATATKCGHIFCLTCIKKALATAKSPTCPTCRNKVSKRGLIRVFLPSTS